MHAIGVVMRGDGGFVRGAVGFVGNPIFRDPPPAKKVVCYCASDYHACSCTNNGGGYPPPELVASTGARVDDELGVELVKVEVTKEIVDIEVVEGVGVETSSSIKDEYKIWQRIALVVALYVSTQLVRGGQQASSTPSARCVHGTELAVSHTDEHARSLTFPHNTILYLVVLGTLGNLAQTGRLEAGLEKKVSMDIQKKDVKAVNSPPYPRQEVMSTTHAKEWEIDPSEAVHVMTILIGAATPHIRPTQSAPAELDLVVASMSKENTTWLHTYLPDNWRKNVYVVDDPTATLTVPENKGHESMVYLTYIIDRYDSLPNNVLFLHASRFAWHNDDPDYDGLPTLRNLRLPYLQEAGYINMRCVWVIGCPAEIRPVVDEGAPSTDLKAKHIYKKAFEEILPELPMPEIVAVSCCSQFGVTRNTIRRRPKEDYIRYRRWLLETPLPDSLSGRVFEFSWHKSSCKDRYILPPYSTLPEGWPRVGWNREDREFSGPL
ncbi:hypothetical protein CHU98_g10464 [Xylaria longipes]|nr:hypothetical protein CHU98_g10464 [Xylaria longipes]